MRHIVMCSLLWLASSSGAGTAWCDSLPMVGAAALNTWLNGEHPPLLLDVRPRAEYLAGTIPGALDAGSDPEGFLPDARGGVVILLTAESTPLASWHDRLSRFGYEVRILKNGMAAWRAAGLPVEVPQAEFVRPGTVPFLIPRGICEMNEPAEVYR